MPSNALSIYERLDGNYWIPRIEAQNVVIVLDCATGVRDARTGLLHQGYLLRLRAFLEAMKDLKRLAILDTDGRSVYSNEIRGGVGFEDVNISEAVNRASMYKRASDQSIFRGMSVGIKKWEKNEPSSVVVFGHRHWNFYTSREEFVRSIHGLLKNRKRALSFVKADNILVGKDVMVGSESSSSVAFNRLGGFLSEKYSGRFYVFQPFGTTRDADEREAIAVHTLFQEYAEMLWSATKSIEWIVNVNQVLDRSGSRVLLNESVDNRGTNIITDTKIEEVEDGIVHCYISFLLGGGSEERDFRAQLNYEEFGWTVVDTVLF